MQLKEEKRKIEEKKKMKKQELIDKKKMKNKRKLLIRLPKKCRREDNKNWKK